MKNYFLCALLVFIFAGQIPAQFSLEKFTNEKLSIFNYNQYSKMTGLTKKVVDEKYENIPVKIEYITLNAGGIMRQSVGSNNVSQISKLFDLFFAELSKKYKKTERDESLGGTRNVVWRAPDNTMLTLSKSPTMTSLTMIKMM